MVARGKIEADVPLFWSLEVHGELTTLKNNMECDFMHYITLHFWETNGPYKSHIFIFLNYPRFSEVSIWEPLLENQILF